MIKPEEFIEYLEYLLGLAAKGRYRKQAWVKMKKLLKQHGYWKNPRDLSYDTAKKMKMVGRRNRIQNYRKVYDVDNRITTTTNEDLGTSSYDE